MAKSTNDKVKYIISEIVAWFGWAIIALQEAVKVLH